MNPYIVDPKVEIPEGAVGVWRIESLNINQPVYKGLQNEQKKIIDKEESALLTQWCQAQMISDHCDSYGMEYKGNWNMSEVHVGDLAMFIQPNKKSLYQCYLIALVDVKPGYYAMNGKILQPTSSKDIGCRCCVGDDSTRNYIAVFRYMQDLKS